jgi:hypothetical protein
MWIREGAAQISEALLPYHCECIVLGWSFAGSSKKDVAFNFDLLIV